MSLMNCEIDSRGVATLSLARPGIHNAFNDELIQQIIAKLIELEKNDDLRLLILTGEGKSFCAGADLNWMKSMKDYSFEENFADSEKLNELFDKLNTFSRPVLGRVNGHALGGGVGLVACCDYVIASNKAKFGFTEVRLGLVPAVISPYCIAKIGESNARAWFLTGERFTTEQALKMGLVHESCDLEQLDERVEAQVDRFLAAGPNGTKAAKTLINQVLSLENKSKKEIYQYTCELISNLRIGEEGQEGMTALLEKRKANWILEK